MTLHEAIVKILHEYGSPKSTQEIADILNENKWYEMRDGSAITAFQIQGRTKNYPALFDRQGSMVYLKGQATSFGSSSATPSKGSSQKLVLRRNRKWH
ncbi:MAG TPA: hypothetical protein PKW49_12400 [Paludibacteraceae bacterium]|jgi:hypothetical protein|nr:hypothetical protein [Paludibacteraceae bacterium]